ncbi:hypothetical protein Acsp03_57620 [Actinomadura sp. NBRC 104412]|uniref:hypothetical protein n=1 Tax=Actinomadura sp. NBRC 104412 TaxID=3032203 RepID=UPI0024A0A3BF|nr:hypothetical protein [Actinomadura sp. NBRC 104412]GLZ08296.1 hypothetical protein Acsp03_57620 [Actinomadura sp. NBRC 104412]
MFIESGLEGPLPHDLDRDEALHRIAGTLCRLGVAHLATLSLETGERINATTLTPR